MDRVHELERQLREKETHIQSLHGQINSLTHYELALKEKVAQLEQEIQRLRNPKTEFVQNTP